MFTVELCIIDSTGNYFSMNSPTTSIFGVVFSFILFVVLVSLWLLSMWFFGFPILNTPFAAVADQLASSGTDFPSGVSTWFELLLYVSVPRLIYALLLTGGIGGLTAYLIFQKAFKKSVPKKKLALVIVGGGLLFFFWIFPQDMFSVKGIPTPPEVTHTAYRYDAGNFNASDQASVFYVSNAPVGEIIAFYERSDVFGPYGFRDYEPSSFFHGYLKNGTDIIIHVSERGGRTYMSFSGR